MLRLGAGAACLTAIATMPFFGAGQASAALPALPIPPILLSTTSVTTTPMTQVQNQSDQITVTATVGPLNLYLTPSGIVFFTVWAPGATIGINSSNIPVTCGIILLQSCQASITFPVGAGNSVNDGKVVPGVWKVEADYSGDSVSQGSHGFGSFTIIQPAA
jgi:hypothetical protein